MFKSIRQRLLVMLGLTALVPIVLLSMYSYLHFRKSWITLNEIDIAYLNRQTTNQLNEVFFKAIDQVFNWKERQEWVDVVEHPAAMATYMETVASETHLIHPLFVLDSAGTILRTNTKSKAGETNRLQDTVGMRFPAYQTFDRTQVAISKWQDLQIGVHTLRTIVLSFPIVDAQAQYRGMAIGLINPSALHAVLRSEQRELKKRSFDSGMVLIVDRETSHVLAVASEAAQSAPRMLVLQRQTESFHVVSLHGAAWLALSSATSFGDNELLIVSLVSRANLLDAAQQLLTVSGLVYGLVLLSIVILIVWCARAISTPIRALATQAEHFGAGDYTTVIRVKAVDEIGRLATFLDQARQNIASYFEVSMAMSTELPLQPLLQRIVAASTTVLKADRSTLFLYDEHTRELWAPVAEGETGRDIRFPSHVGIAGAAFTTRAMLNIPNAYAESRFNPVMDHMTGYRTRSILCHPLINKAGKVLGVIQALNKHGGFFTSADETHLRALAAHASIALDNAQLFEAVLNIKNYNESILLSLSNGVITLDADHTIVTCNEAALRIFHTTTQQSIGWAASTFFAGDNAWVLQKLQSVLATGTSNITMDADIVLPNEHTVSVNCTVVPLLNVKHERMGSMLVFENITREKRIKSTMTRYMTKEVVEKLLESGEETLGGQLQVASILFADIRNFTGLTERMGAHETVVMLNEYFTRMADVVLKYDGILDKYIGDALMAVFGAPFSSGEDADRAVKTGVEMMRVLRDFNQQRLQHSHTPLDIGIGISTDEVVSGNIGSLQRMDYTVIGNGVNLASRLESANKLYKTNILISEFTFHQLKDTYITQVATY